MASLQKDMPYQSLGLSINIGKTKIIAPDNIEGPPDFNISGITLEVVEYFPYLGGRLPQNASAEAGI